MVPVEIPFDSQISVAEAPGIGLALQRPKNGQMGRIEIQFQVKWKARIYFEIRRILAEVGKLFRLKGIELVEELNMPLSARGDAWIVGVER